MKSRPLCACPASSTWHHSCSNDHRLESQQGRNESSFRGERSMTSMRHWIRTAGLGLAAMLIAVPASAQIVQSAHFGIGAFYPRGFDSRDANDTLVADLTTAEPLAFDIGQFTSVTFFGEWIVELGPHISVG